MSADSFEAPSLELLAELLPAYDFEAFIAQGGMGAVYKARQRSLDRDVAIKILPRELGEDPEFHLSFETEAKAMARLNHPNLIGVYDYGDVDGMPYIVMEFVNGKSLFHSAYNMQVDPIQAVTIVKGICDGLAHAHENGVIHRDIKPANILLNERVVPKIGDFGLARPSDEAGSGVIMGTPGYVAPEVFHHPEKADRRSDLFALGVVLYELLIGRCPPFNNYQPPASTVCGCDVALDRICDKAMHPVASLRYQTAEDFSADLDAWLRKASAPAAVQPVAGRRAGGPRKPPRAATTYRTSGSHDSSSGGIKGLLMLAAAVAVVAIGWSKFSSAQDDALPKGSSVGKDGPAVVSPADTKRPDRDRDRDIGKGLPDAKDSAATTAAPLESLAKLKAALVSGKRDAMPEGSVKLGESHFMVIPTPMSWTAAQAFAAKHGAQLFVAESDKALQQVARLMPAPAEADAEAGLWIGAGTVAGQSWSWIDGSSWDLETKPEGKGSYLILDAKGGLQARETADRYPFVIQWQADGTNPSTLALVLARAGKSIESGTPVLPPGTIEYEGHLIYFAYSTGSFSKAMELCTEAKGHLMVLDSEEKAKWLAEHLPAEDIKDGLWAGGHRQDEKWIWLTGEPLRYTRWQDAAQPDNPGGFLKVIPGGDWLSADAGDQASGFIVEWDISPGGGAVEGDDVAAPPIVAELEAKAKELLENLNKDRDKDLAANAKAFAWDVDGWHKDLGKSEQSSWNRDVAMFKALVKGNRVPAVVDAASGIRLSQGMSKIHEFCLTKQKAIDAAFESKADKIRASYATRMGELGKKLATDGDAKGAKAADSRAAKAADLKAWLPAMIAGVEEVMNAAAPAAPVKPGVAGRWVWLSKEIVTIRPDGTLYNHSNKFKGTWKAKGFGGTNYEFAWEDGKWIDQLTIDENGSHLSGSNQNGDDIFGWRIVQGSDPIVDAWVWTPAICIFCDDHTVRKGKDSGTWTLVSNEGGERSYSVRWQSGFEDNVTLAKDPDTFKGTNNNGDKVTGKRVPRS